MKLTGTLILLFLLPPATSLLGQSSTNSLSYAHHPNDTARYNEIKALIGSSTNHLLGKSLEEVSGLLSLKGVPWDLGYNSFPRGEVRIYHFRGFFLWLQCEILPKGITPTSLREFGYTEPELRTNGVRWLMHQHPFVHIDGLTNRVDRMTNYWAGVDDMFRRRNDEINKRKMER